MSEILNELAQAIVARAKIVIHWSDEDCCFIAESPDCTGGICHGETRDEAFENIKDLLHEWCVTQWQLAQKEASK